MNILYMSKGNIGAQKELSTCTAQTPTSTKRSTLLILLITATITLPTALATLIAILHFKQTT